MYKNNINTKILENMETYDTMILNQLPNYLKKLYPHYKKYIKLNELYKLLFEKNIKNAHRVSEDIDVTTKCFILIYQYNQIEKK